MDNGSDRLFTIAVPPDEMNQVAAMANFAMQTLDLIDVDNFKRKVINVADAKKQVRYYWTFFKLFKSNPGISLNELV